MIVNWTTYSAAIAETEHRPRHLLLGNGFSMAVYDGFGYRSLYEGAVREDPGLATLFEGHGVDFEKALGGATAERDRDRIRAQFIAAITRAHPKPKFMKEEMHQTCGLFLDSFAGLGRGVNRGSVFTTNYDLLLYWVLMKNKASLKLYDGFDTSGVWDTKRTSNSFVFYLHGALHLFEQRVGRIKTEILQRKLLNRGPGASLIEQVRDNMDKGYFPTFVSEGTHYEKRWRINNSPYLKRVGRHFASACARSENALFTVGHSLSAVDAHITDDIGLGSASLYIGVYRPADDGSAVRNVIQGWADHRASRGRDMPRVQLFDTSECPIWSPRPAAS